MQFFDYLGIWAENWNLWVDISGNVKTGFTTTSICIFRKVAWYTRAVDLAQFYRKNARGTQKNKGTASIFAWFCTRSRGHGQQRDPAKTSGRRPLRKRCRFTIDPQVQYLLVEGTALGIYSSQALKGSDAAQPTGCSASLCAMCYQWNHRSIDDRRDLPIWISSMEIQSNIKTGFTTTSIGTNSQNL